MRLTLAAIALATALAPAAAKDISLPPLNDDQQKALIQLLDLAVKGGGLAVAQNAAFFYMMIQSAQLVPEAPAADAKPGAEPLN